MCPLILVPEILTIAKEKTICCFNLNTTLLTQCVPSVSIFPSMFSMSIGLESVQNLS
jgi:hypothetical protein